MAVTEPSIEELMEQSKDWFRYEKARAPIASQGPITEREIEGRHNNIQRAIASETPSLFVHPNDPRCYMCAGTGLTLRLPSGPLTARPVYQAPHHKDFYKACRDAPCPYCYQGVMTYGVFPDPYADLSKGRPKSA